VVCATTGDFDEAAVVAASFWTKAEVVPALIAIMAAIANASNMMTAPFDDFS
jgi:hypothetical protein